jgi:hypothetical protein
MASSNPPSKLESFVEAMFGKGARIVHPCDAFAQRAGFDSWAAALVAMKRGQIVTATGPRIGRTTLDFDLFIKQVQIEGLLMISPAHDECGFVSIGLRAHFPAETLERFQGEIEQRLVDNPLRFR